MKQYKVQITPEAKKDLKRYRDYLIVVKKNQQAAKNVVLDFHETAKQLRSSAGSLKEPESEKLKMRRLQRINFQKHDYFLLYRVDEDVVSVTNMFHSREDYEEKIR